MTTTITVGTQAVFFVPTAQAITFTPGRSGKVFVTIDSGNRPHAQPGPLLVATAVSIPAGSTVYANAVGSNGTYSDVSTGGGGGATTFAALTDVETPFYAGNQGRVPVVNIAEDKLTPIPDPGLNLLLQAGDSVDGDTGGNVLITGGSDVEGSGAGSVKLIGGIDATGGGAGDVQLFGGIEGGGGYAGAVDIRGGDAFTATKKGGDVYMRGGDPGAGGVRGSIFMNHLPTVDPAIADALWNSSGTLKISAGP